MLNVGVIGGGKWGKNHIRNFSQLDCNLVGLADTNSQVKKLANEYKISFYSDYRELLKHVDAVSIVTPTDTHYDLTKECLRQNKHVLVEKPITLDSKQALELVKLSEKKKLILTVGHVFRFNPSTIRLKKELGSIGDLQYITMRYIHSTKPPRKDSGAVFNLATHLFDILNFILEKLPRKIYCEKINYLSDKLEDAVNIILDYDGFYASLEASWFHPLKKRDGWFIASERKAYVDFLDQTIIIYPIKIDFDSTIKHPSERLEIGKKEPLNEELKHFLNCIKNNENPINNAYEAYLTTRLCEISLESANKSEAIRVDL